MGRLGTIAGGIAMVLALLSGCANIQSRQWGTCGTAGVIIGAAVGGITSGVALNNTGSPSNGERAGAIIGGTIGGAAIGGLLGHVLCDPEREAESAPPPPPAS